MAEQRVCRYFLAGTCRFGERCHFAHPAAAAEPVARGLNVDAPEFYPFAVASEIPDDNGGCTITYSDGKVVYVHPDGSHETTLEQGQTVVLRPDGQTYLLVQYDGDQKWVPAIWDESSKQFIEVVDITNDASAAEAYKALIEHEDDYEFNHEDDDEFEHFYNQCEDAFVCGDEELKWEDIPNPDPILKTVMKKPPSAAAYARLLSFL